MTTQSTTSARPVRVRAPEFPSGTWLNTPAPLSLHQLRGRLVLLDFWTFCCVNCLHVIDELRALESEFGDAVVVIGVHSPKFEHEKSDAAVAAAVARHDVAHPVYNDPLLRLWGQYAVRAWPSLVLIDATGRVMAHAAGEGHVPALQSLIRGELDRSGAAQADHDPSPPTTAAATSGLRYPAKAVRFEDTLLIADAGHHQIAQTDLSGQQVRRRFGDGVRGRTTQRFAEPNGMAVLPRSVADRLGYDVLVADTANHALRGLRLSDGAIASTVDLAAGLAGARTVTGGIPEVLSPWDVVWWPAIGRAVVAAAGVHLLLSWDPTGEVAVLAGTTVEGLRDGPALDGWLAQPSGLAVDGDQLWFVDAETSALRTLSADGRLRTRVGQGLFDFGHVDGSAAAARLQHPLGVAVLSDGSIAVADTYNGAIRRFDPATEIVETIASGLDEPSGVVVQGHTLLVVESGAHRLTPVGISASRNLGPRLQTDRPVLDLAAGAVTLEIAFEPPAGQGLDRRHGPATRLTVSASPPQLLADGAGDSVELSRTVTMSAATGSGVLHISAQAASCSEGEHAACHLARQDWGIPVRVTATGQRQLRLALLDQTEEG